ncbi:MAG: RraA family protein [Nanoarchaeota archaeon]
MNNKKKYLSTASISDILDSKGYKNQMLDISIKPNFIEAKIFGKAKIISIKPIKDNNYKEVYKGLYFLESLKEGEILIVANGFRDYAFFGELMSTLAKSKKVEGAIIDGCTRDKLETVKLKFPVFSKGNIARDIKNRGIIDKVDLDSARISDVSVNKGDYLFGDADGVIVIPKNISTEVIEKAIKSYELERKIKEDIKNGISVDDLLKRHGEF